MFKLLEEINSRPEPFQFYTADELWTDEYTSEQMLKYHLNGDVDLSSRNKNFIEKSTQWIASQFQLDSGKKVIDFGCGPGLYTTRLAEAKADVTGIDFSQRSLEYARDTAKKKGLEINYVRQNYLDFETEDRFDLITMIMCDFCVLSPAQRQTLLKKFHTLLKPGGSVLLDVYSLHTFSQKEEAVTYEEGLLYGFWSPDKYYGFLNTFKYEEAKVMLDKFTIIEAERKRVIYNWLQHFSRESLCREFEAAGFQVAEIYSDVAGTPYKDNGESPEIAIVAKKPGNA
ncbi:MAG: methyltransferase domain-containing protein [bacterium]|nr:methyltransferase domain-containing protein [bacterium]